MLAVWLFIDPPDKTDEGLLLCHVVGSIEIASEAVVDASLALLVKNISRYLLPCRSINGELGGHNYGGLVPWIVGGSHRIIDLLKRFHGEVSNVTVGRDIQ